MGEYLPMADAVENIELELFLGYFANNIPRCVLISMKNKLSN